MNLSQKARMLEAVVLGVVIAAAIIGGVTLTQQSFFNSNSSESRSSLSDETGILAAQITDPPNVQEGVTHVFLNYSDVEVHADGVANNSGWFTIANAGTVDLMSVVNVSLTLGSAEVSSGLFTLARLDISSAWVTYFGSNYTAVVPQNEISVPITNGGVYVSVNGSSGLLIDISPTVVPFQNGTTIGFVIVPSATSLPVSPSVWHKSLEQQGSTVANGWLHDSQETLVQNITLEYPYLTVSSFQVRVTNNGNVDTRLTSISILEAGSSNSPVSSPYQSGGGMTVASFQILSNGTVVPPVYQPKGQLEGDNAYAGYALSTGQSITLSYSGFIAMLSVGETMSHVGLGIIPGTIYQIKISTSSGMSPEISVNATNS